MTREQLSLLHLLTKEAGIPGSIKALLTSPQVKWLAHVGRKSSAKFPVLPGMHNDIARRLQHYPGALARVKAHVDGRTASKSFSRVKTYTAQAKKAKKAIEQITARLNSPTVSPAMGARYRALRVGKARAYNKAVRYRKGSMTAGSAARKAGMKRGRIAKRLRIRPLPTPSAAPTTSTLSRVRSPVSAASATRAATATRLSRVRSPVAAASATRAARAATATQPAVNRVASAAVTQPRVFAATDGMGIAGAATILGLPAVGMSTNIFNKMFMRD